MLPKPGRICMTCGGPVIQPSPQTDGDACNTVEVGAVLGTAKTIKAQKVSLVCSLLAFVAMRIIKAYNNSGARCSWFRLDTCVYS